MSSDYGSQNRCQRCGYTRGEHGAYMMNHPYEAKVHKPEKFPLGASDSTRDDQVMQLQHEVAERSDDA